MLLDVLRRCPCYKLLTPFSGRDVDRLAAEQRDCTTVRRRADKPRDAVSC